MVPYDARTGDFQEARLLDGPTWIKKGRDLEGRGFTNSNTVALGGAGLCPFGRQAY